MPIDPNLSRNSLLITGSLRINCGDFQFKFQITPENLVLNFPSFGMLARAKAMGSDFANLAADIPPLPNFPTSSRAHNPIRPAENIPTAKPLFVAVDSRPVGKLQINGSSVKFSPTPLRFFKKLK